MSYSSANSFVRKMADNMGVAVSAAADFGSAVMRPTPYNANIPWQDMKIESPETFTYRENRVIRFQLPREGMIDPKSLRISFNARAMPNVVTGSSSHLPQFVFDINSIFSDALLCVGRGSVLCEQSGYNLLSRTLNKLGLQYSFVETARSMYNGYGINGVYQQAGMNARFGYHSQLGNTSGSRPINMDVARRYMTSITLGLFMQNRPIVLDPFNEQLELELVIDRGNMAIMHNQGISATINDYYVEVGYPCLHFTYYPLHFETPLYKTVQNQLASKNGFTYQFLQWSHNTATLNSKVQRQVINIPVNHKYLRYALAIILCDADSYTQALSSFRTYSSLDPTASWGNGFFNENDNVGSAAAVEQRRNFKRSSIKQYQWIYNRHYRVPEKPCQVRNLQLTRAIVGSTGADAEPLISSANNIAPVSPIDHPYAETCGEEAWYHLEQCLLRDKDEYMTFSLPMQEAMYVPFDAPHPGYGSFTASDEGNETAKYFGTSGGTTTTRIASQFVMAGCFSKPMYDGSVACLQGGPENETLQLEIETNGVTSNATPPQMVLHTFVAYDTIMSLKFNDVTLDQ